ncbi:MAG: NADH-quinone oxidoreductase subunit L [Bacteroidetes bacterium]|nr:NADH-quinone oxidoreductase subunit L [Bacteroidota bacterium]MBS1540403.1 NADH-quinone oxidoreductase subunit L [Bacteroidota bacterium]
MSLWLIPALPLLGAFVLIVFGQQLPKRLIPIIGSGSVGLSAALTFALGYRFISSSASSFHIKAWQWMDINGFSPAVAFHLDALSLVFIFVITFVGFLIHVYSAEFMVHDDGYARFFAYLNLFVCSMLTLVLADNFVLMYLGWEGVGLCSYLLIGFWYAEEKNGYAARKAFIVTRVGDISLAFGLFMLFQQFHTLNIQEVAAQAAQHWTVGSETALIISLLLLGGAVGKSAQLPLQTWLPDAMAGPSPVSALIHAATMVTAGVYLIARTHVIFELAPDALMIVGIIGAVTLVLAGFAALTQFDLKRVLAYSTISQIGYMFLALGVSAWSAAIFHFMIHAFFKALLFLAAGAVIESLHHEHDMFKMGGLKNKLPVVYWTFLIGAGSLAALPLITGGFYSKDQILWLSLAGEHGHIWFFLAALVGAFVTSVYTFRMMFLTFFGKENTPVGHVPGKGMNIPLIVLAILTTVGGFIELPHTFGHVTFFSDFLKPILPAVTMQEEMESFEWLIQLVAALVALSGVGVAYYFFIYKPDQADELKSSAADLHSFWLSGWGFDKLYDKLVVQPYVYLSNVNKNDVIDKLYESVVTVANWLNRILAYTQSGILRWYIMGIVIGGILLMALALI